MGRAAFVHLLKLRDQAPAPKIKKRLSEILEKYESRKALGIKEGH